MSDTNTKLWQPLRVGAVTLSHRLIMAPLTRYRNADSHAPITPMMTKYYADRACVPGTLIITEATGVSGAAEARAWLPSVRTPEQVAGWKEIYAAIHARGSFVFQQLWDLGRGADPEYVQGRGYKYASSGNVELEGRGATPEALTEDEIWQKIDEFKQAARNVVDAGGDGVEIHGAHGYLVDQFTRDSVNNRSDKWGGSVENRSRFLLEVIKAVAGEIGAEKTALRLSPFALHQMSYSSDTWEQTTHLVSEIKKAGIKLAYLSLVEPRFDPSLLDVEPSPDRPQPFTKKTPSLDFIFDIWDNFSPIVVAGGYKTENACEAVDEKYAKYDVGLAIGRFFISNPDLVFRVKNKVDFSPYNRDTFYDEKSPIGYNDYEFSKEALAAGLVPA